MKKIEPKAKGPSRKRPSKRDPVAIIVTLLAIVLALNGILGLTRFLRSKQPEPSNGIFRAHIQMEVNDIKTEKIAGVTPADTFFKSNAAKRGHEALPLETGDKSQQSEISAQITFEGKRQPEKQIPEQPAEKAPITPKKEPSEPAKKHLSASQTGPSPPAAKETAGIQTQAKTVATGLPDFMQLMADNSYQQAAQVCLNRVKALKMQYTISLEVDCQTASLQSTFKRCGYDANMFILPRKIGNRSCFVILWGNYATQQKAQEVISNDPRFLKHRFLSPMVVLLNRYYHD